LDFLWKDLAKEIFHVPMAEL